MLRIGLISWWHVHAKDYAADANAHPTAQLVATWDEDAARGRAEAQQRGLHYHEQLDDLLHSPDIDAVIVTTPTTTHREVMIAAAQAGKHIFTEKVLAATVADAQAILDAVERHNVRLVVSLPRLYTNYTASLTQWVRSGLLGELTLVRVRHAHHGSVRSAEQPDGWLPLPFYDRRLSAGGALIDLGCHPVYLTRWLLGMPEQLHASFGYVTQRPVEDNAVVTLRYANGALGVAETAFTSPYHFSIEVYGTLGNAHYREPGASLWLRTHADRDWRAVELPSNVPPSAFARWVEHIQQGTDDVENLTIARDLTALMEAAYRSAERGAAEPV
jgi:1,5-anhydro-D-fructose reductase (1,5-anhydro-D-mannitol-forming)